MLVPGKGGVVVVAEEEVVVAAPAAVVVVPGGAKVQFVFQLLRITVLLA